MTPIPALVERIVAALAGLVVIADSIEDEWTYIHDLETVWVARLRTVAAEHREEPLSGLEAAIDGLVAEVALIEDPHRAIDWMSTLPQVALVALREEAW